MANAGSSSTPEIKINFSYESKTSANAKLKTRISEIEKVAKSVQVGIDFKSNTDTLKNLKNSLTGVRDKLNKITLDGFNKNLKEALSNTEKLVKELEKANKSPYARKVMAKSSDSTYDIKAVREAEKEAIASIKKRQEKYNEMVKESKAKIQELTKAEKESKKEAEKAITQLAKAQEKADKQKEKDAEKRAKEEEKSIERITKAQQKALEKQQKAYEKSLLAIEKQKEKLEIGVQNKTQTVDFQKDDYQRVLDYVSQTGNISEKVIADLQKRINSLNVKTKAEEIREISKSLSTISKNDSEITRLNKKLETIKTKIADLKGQAFDLNNESALNKLKELEEQLEKVEDAGFEMSNGVAVNLNAIRPSIDNIESDLKSMEKSFKSATTQASTFGGGFKQLAITLGLVDLGRESVMYLTRAFKDGIGTVVEMDTAMADLNKVANLSAEGLDRAKSSAVQLGKEVGRSSIEVAKAQAEFGRVYKDIDTINQMTKTAIIGANVMDGATTEEVAKGLNTVISSLKLNASDVVTILDSMNEVQNNFNISSDNMLEALGKVGSTAHTAGASLQELEGYITAISEATGADGGEIGNSLRSMMTRIYKIGEDTFDEGDPELALNAIGVAVRDVSGEFRDINDILTDLDKVWGTLTNTQKIATGQVVAGINQYDKFVSLLNNFSRATEATATAMDSAGSATKENEIYLQSIEGRLSTLKATMEGFWLNLVDSDLLKSGVSLLQLLADSLVGLQNVFGTAGLTVGVLSTAFISFTDNPLKKFIAETASSDKVIKTLITNFKDIKTNSMVASAGMTISQKSTLLLKTAYTQLGLQAVFATVKTMALQAVLTGGLSLAISAVVSLLSSMWTGLADVNSKIGEVTEASKELGTTLDNTTSNSVDLDSYKKLQEKLEDTNLAGEERKKTEEELEQVKKRLYELDDSAYSILNNQNLTYEKQLEILKKINEEKAFEKAKELDEKMNGGLWGLGEGEDDRVRRAKEIAEFSVSAYKELTALQKDANGGAVDFKGQNIDLARQNELLDIYKKQIEDGVLAVDKYNSVIELMKTANYNTERTTFSLSDSVREFNDILKESTDTISENTEAKEENALAGGGGSESSVEELTKAYSETLSTLQSIYDLSQSLNEVTEMTPDLVGQVAKMFPEIGADITDVAKVQEYLNQKIKDQETIANEAYENLISNDNNYYQNKLLNDANWVESFRQSLISMGMSQEEAYDLDLKQFDNLNQLKTYAMNTLGKGIQDWLNQYIDTSAEGYNIDFKNFKSFAEAKIAVLQALNAEIKKVTQNLRTSELLSMEIQNRQQNGLIYGAQGALDKLVSPVVNQNINKYKDQLNSLAGAIEEVENKIPNIGAGGINLGNIGFNPIGASPGSSSDDKKGSSSSSKEASTYKATLEKWYALNDAIEDNNNAIEQNQILRERASGTAEEQKYIEKEIELLKKQISLKKQLQAEMEKERNSLKNYIASRGGKFNGENLTNYEALLNWTAVGDEQIESYKALEEAIKSYTELCNSEIPGVIKDWQGLQDEIDDLLGTHERYNATLEEWYELKDAITDVSNALEQNRIKSERASGKDKIDLMNQEIDLLNKQVALNQKLQKEMEKSRDEQKKFLESNGAIFVGENIMNYEELFGKEAVGKKNVELLKKMEEALKKYTDLTNSEIPNITKEWEELTNQIKEVKEEQFSMVTDFEKDLYDVIAHYAKKENDLRKKDLEAEKEAINEKKKLLEERKKLLQDSFDKEDREDAIAESQQTLNELDAQIQEALRSGDKELAKRLREQYAEQQKLLNEQIREQERNNALDELDKIGEAYDKEIEDLEDVAEELDKKLEEYLSPSNMNKVIEEALNSGFVNIMGQTVEVNKVMSDFLKETTTGVYSTKEALKELEEQLKNVGAIVSQLPQIADSLGLFGLNADSGISSRGIATGASQLVLNSPLVNIESIDNDSIGKFNEIMNEKINWLIDKINGKFNY